MKTVPRGSAENRSRLLLLLTAGIWGFAFTAQRAGMEHMGPLAFNGARFLLGALVLLPFYRRRISLPMLVPCVISGAVLFAGAFLQQWGMVYTSASKAGFITGLYLVFIPVIGSVFRERESAAAWAGFSLALFGLYLLSFTDGFKAVNPGDVLLILGALAWAFHVRLIGRFASSIHPGGLALGQFTVCAFLSVVGALVFGESFSGAGGAVIPLAYSGILSVGLAFTLQVFAQKRVRPSAAGAIMALEAVFAALGGWMILGESLSFVELAGCFLMLAGAFLAARSQGAARERLDCH